MTKAGQGARPKHVWACDGSDMNESSSEDGLVCDRDPCRDVSCPVHGTKATYPETVPAVDAFIGHLYTWLTCIILIAVTGLFSNHADYVSIITAFPIKTVVRLAPRKSQVIPLLSGILGVGFDRTASKPYAEFGQMKIGFRKNILVGNPSPQNHACTYSWVGDLIFGIPTRCRQDRSSSSNNSAREFQIPVFGESKRFQFLVRQPVHVEVLKSIYGWSCTRVFPYGRKICNSIGGVGLPNEITCVNTFKSDEWPLNGHEGLSANSIRLDHFAKLSRIDTRKFYSDDKQQSVQNDLRPINTMPPLRWFTLAAGVVISVIGMIVLFGWGNGGRSIIVMFGLLCFFGGTILALWSI